MAGRSPHCLATLAALVIAAGSPVAGNAPSVEDFLRLGAGYLSEYALRLGAVAADEDYVQNETSLGKTSTPTRLTAQVVWLGIAENGLEDFRDVVGIDSRPLRAADDRLFGLFKAPTEASRDKARQITEDGVRHYVSANLHVIDQPMLALEFLRAANQTRSTYKLEGVKTMNGAHVAVLKFTEKDAPRLVSVPENAPAVGRFWIDAASGTIRQTEIGFAARSFNFHALVKYASDATTKLWLPVEMSQRCQLSGPGSSPINYMGANGGYSAHEELEGRARYANYRQVAVDLAKLR